MAVSLSGAALAADIPVRTPYYKAPGVVAPVVYNWSGFYVGGNIGYGRMETDTTIISGTTTFPTGTVLTSARSKGVLGGGQIGYNWQWGNWVLGFEGEYDAANLNGTARSVGVGAGFSDATYQAKWIGLATGRLGYAWNNWLLYAKGGGAWVRNDAGSNTFTAGGTLTTVTSGRETRDGWTIGGGIEWGLGNNWSAKVEYNHIDLGSATVGRTVTLSTNPVLLPVGTVALRTGNVDIDMVKFGLNYRFNWAPVVARY